MPRDFNVKDFGATGNGSTNDSIAIRKTIAAAVAVGGGVVYFPNGTYIISPDSSNPWCLLLANNISLLGETREGAILKMAGMQSGDRRLISMTRVHDVNICNLSINGNKRANGGLSEQSHGIFASATVRLTVSGVTSYDNRGDGIYVHSGSSDALIENCYIHDNARNGVSIGGGGQERITVRSCQIRNNVAQQIDTEMDKGAFVKDITVEDCHLVSLADFGLTLSGDNANAQSKGFLINNNVIEGSVYAVWATDVRFTNNRLTTRTTDVAPPLVIFRRCDRFIVANNTITANNTNYSDYPATAIEIQGVAGTKDRPSAIVADNYVNANVDAIFVNNPLDVLISGNCCRGSTGAFAGIEVRPTIPDATKSVVVVDNHFIDFQWGLRAYGYVGVEAINDLVINNNVFEQDTISSTTAMDLNADNFSVVKQAAVIGNTLLGSATSMFGGPFGGYPNVPLLVGGNLAAGAVFSCSGPPQFAANAGSMALNRAGGGGTTLYIKESGSGSAGWQPK